MNKFLQVLLAKKITNCAEIWNIEGAGLWEIELLWFL